MVLISIHASRGGSDFRIGIFAFLLLISIHASRGGSDECERRGWAKVIISIHASRGGSDLVALILFHLGAEFQSTLPVGEATVWSCADRFADNRFQSTLPVGEATAASTCSISDVLFQSTLPVGEATFRFVLLSYRK